jgi:hypothetical protein
MQMADLILKLRRSRSTLALFGGRVAGAADASRVMDYANLDAPAAFVVYLSDDCEPEPRGVNEVYQRLTVHWGVVVKLSAHVDIRGQAPTMTAPGVREALFKALLNWSPYEVPPGPPFVGRPPQRPWSPLAYEKCELLQVNRDSTFWMFQFATDTILCAEDGETEEQFDPLPDFHGANVKVDWTDPHDPGLPPSEEYDPTRGPAPWPSGPEGRIEAEFRVDQKGTPP